MREEERAREKGGEGRRPSTRARLARRRSSLLCHYTTTITTKSRVRRLMMTCNGDKVTTKIQKEANAEGQGESRRKAQKQQKVPSTQSGKKRINSQTAEQRKWTRRPTWGQAVHKTKLQALFHPPGGGKVGRQRASVGRAPVTLSPASIIPQYST